MLTFERSSDTLFLISKQMTALIDRNRWYTVFTKLYLKSLASGKTPGEAFKHIQQMGYDETRRSLYNHVSSFKASGGAIKREKGKRRRNIIIHNI